MVMIDTLTTGGVVAKLEAAGVQPDMIGTAVTSINQQVKSGVDPTTAAGQQALQQCRTVMQVLSPP